MKTTPKYYRTPPLTGLTAYPSNPTQNHPLPDLTYSDTSIHNTLTGTHTIALPVMQDTGALKVTWLVHPIG